MFSLVPWRKSESNGGALARRDDPFALLRREFDSMFDHFFSGWPALPGTDFGPNGWGFTLKDEGKEYVVRAEAPGFEASEFDVQVQGDALVIRAEHRQEVKQEGEEGQQGASYGRYERWVTLPPGTDRDKVEARYRNGVLEVRLPKTPEALGRKVEVKS